MKILRTSYTDIVVLDVTMVVSEKDIVVSEILPQHQKSILPKYQVSAEILGRYQDLVMSSIATIQQFSEIEIHKNPYQSGESYTCYIPTISITIPQLEVRFRIADHDTIDEPIDLQQLSDDDDAKQLVYVKTLLMNNIAIDDEFVLLSAIQEICQGIVDGDKSKIIKKYNL